MTLSWPEPITPPAGNADRFGGRWRLVGAGLSNVWRYGDLELPAPSGRLLLRGTNGTGKTTTLEALWPYLLDLNSARLAAGKARNTTLSGLMREGADGRRRVGYAWLSFAGPDEEDTVSYGVRLNFSEGGTPPVRVGPFTVPGRPLHELPLWGSGRTTISTEQFADDVARLGGVAFDDPEAYVRDLATRIFATDAGNIGLLAERIRQVRNPALLGELSPREAAEALRASLPGVADDVIEATGEALAESDATRKAFEDDRAAAVALDMFAKVWTGHAIEVTATYHRRAMEAAERAKGASRGVKKLEADHLDAVARADEAAARQQELARELEQLRGRLSAIEHSEEYIAAGRLADLAVSVASREQTADAKWAILSNSASQAASVYPEDVRHATNLGDDVAALIEEVTPFVPAVAGTRIFGWEKQTRPPYRVGERHLDAGPVLALRTEESALDDTIGKLQRRSAELSRTADRARTFLGAYQTVATAEATALGARSEAGRLAATADEKGRAAKTTAEEARSQAAALAEALTAWLSECAGTEDIPISFDDLDDVAWQEPHVALNAVDRFASNTATWAHRTAARSRVRADGLDQTATEQRTQAAKMHAEAEHMRTGDVLLPFPRPEWAGEGDDGIALGAALTWREHVDSATQDTIEATVAAAGLLGATLTSTGAKTTAWAVQAGGEQVEPNLGEVLDVERDHPLAQVAGAVLARIALSPTAVDNNATALVVGLDGTFRAGVLAAAVPGAQDPGLRQSATHIGARRRREAALARANQLDHEADGLAAEAVTLAEQAAAERTLASHVIGLLNGFPKRDSLRDAESARVVAAQAQRAADEATARAEKHADALTHSANEERTRWTLAVAHEGLPTDVTELTTVTTDAKTAATTLASAARRLDQTFRSRISELAAAIAAHDTTAILDVLHAEAITAFRDAESARAGYEELRQQVGRDSDDILRHHKELEDLRTGLDPELQTAIARAGELSNRVVEVNAELKGARQRAAETEPAAAQSVAELRALLVVPGVLEAVLATDLDADDNRLLGQVAAALGGKERYAKRTVRERADEIRAKLAGAWSVDPGPDHAELDTYLLTHGATSLTPVAAAAHARLLADRAEEALRAADEQALREFVIGRLPAAIAQAWTRLFDWVNEVNTMMKSASASSGVGVAVRIWVKDELPELVRTVYELCRTGAVLRDSDAKAEAGRALHQLINAADGDSMTARVREAVDVRDWVDVTYQVTRPGEKPKNWGSRTGLSGGERRLVVLAPMLAAVAAAYDKFPRGAARLAALDEVPSEVDEEGREGLARYIAELDLDLIATSHQWDGAPGAWDGCDAHDLEIAPDGTVVAFPMLVRGLDLLPGDPVQ